MQLSPDLNAAIGAAVVAAATVEMKVCELLNAVQVSPRSVNAMLLEGNKKWRDMLRTATEASDDERHQSIQLWLKETEILLEARHGLVHASWYLAEGAQGGEVPMAIHPVRVRDSSGKSLKDADGNLRFQLELIPALLPKWEELGHRLNALRSRGAAILRTY